MERIYNVLISNIYNKGLTESLMKEDETLKKKREDLTRVLALLDKALRNLTSVNLSHGSASRSNPLLTPGAPKNPWETSGGSSNEIDWSIVKGTKSLLSRK